MVKKKFVDKRTATTYSLIYRATEDADDVPERMLVEADRGVGLGRPDAELAAATAAAAEASGRRYPPGHPLAWLDDGEPASAPISEARRRELIELGFPDDGYDYLKHTRVLGRGTTSLEPHTPGVAAEATAAPGPSVFLPALEVAAPEEDRRVIDASRLTVMQAVAEEGDAAVMAGGVTAFSRDRPRVHGTDKRELDELEAALAAAEADEEWGDAEGTGDLTDDFVVAATEVGRGDDDAGDEGAGGGESDVESYDDSDDEGGSSLAGSDDPDAARGGSRGGARPGSIASTYWRDERTDRKNLLTVIDERFEALAVEYDEDEIGDLEEQGGAIRGFADVAEFDNLMDEFLEVHGQSQTAHEGNMPYAAPRISQVAREMAFHGLDDSDAAAAVLHARAALRRAEAEEREREERAARGEAAPREPRAPYLEPRERERWDCESVLSMHSNLDNHPGTISEPAGYRQRRRGAASEAGGAAGAAAIQLDARGIPKGVVPRRGAGAAPEPGGGPGEDGEGGPGGVAPERVKGETAEEKRARKAAVKEAQRAARAQKKELKGLFRKAEVQAQRRAATAQPQAAVKLP